MTTTPVRRVRRRGLDGWFESDSETDEAVVKSLRFADESPKIGVRRPAPEIQEDDEDDEIMALPGDRIHQEESDEEDDIPTPETPPPRVRSLEPPPHRRRLNPETALLIKKRVYRCGDRIKSLVAWAKELRVKTSEGVVVIKPTATGATEYVVDGKCTDDPSVASRVTTLSSLRIVGELGCRDCHFYREGPNSRVMQDDSLRLCEIVLSDIKLKM